MSGPLFDVYLMVDWSAAGTPRTGKDSIWIASGGRSGPITLENPATRREAMDRIRALVGAATTAGHRVLAGFDFPFGYPAGTAERFGGWQGLWARIAEEIEEGDANANNRFDAAARLNAAFEGDGPFYGNGLKREIDGLPRTLPNGYGTTLPARKRRAEVAAPGSQETWKLIGAGSVGGQALTGIACLERLRQEIEVRIWPFEHMGDNLPVIAEIFPSLFDPHPDEAIRDAGQVRATVERLRDWDSDGTLKVHLEAPRALPPEIATEEGWILGADTAPAKPRARALSYLKDPGAIYEESFRTVEKEARLDRFPPLLRPLVTRLVHAIGMPEIADRLAWSERAAETGIAALAEGAPILCDCEMVRAGITRRFLPDGLEPVVTLNDETVPDLAKEIGNTRSAAAVRLWKDRLDGAIVAIGNAPTALFHLLELLDEGWPRPALILGFPVGFVGAAEAKAELARNPRGAEFVALRGRRGGSALASAAVNALALEAGGRRL